MLLTEFDEKKYKRTIYREGYEDGERAGADNKIRSLIHKKLQKGKSVEEIAEELEEDIDTIRAIVEKYEKLE